MRYFRAGQAVRFGQVQHLPHEFLPAAAQMAHIAAAASVDDAARLLYATCHEHGVDTQGLRSLPGVATAHTDVMTVQGTGIRCTS